MTQETGFKFIIWSYYYHGIVPETGRSYAECGKFSRQDAQRLDGIKETLFMCFEPESVRNACRQFARAKTAQEPCPFPQELLDSLFAKEQQV